MSDIWRWPVLKRRMAIQSRRRTTTSTPSIISDRCTPKKYKTPTYIAGPTIGNLVDPDNRSVVDFAARKHTLDWAFPADLAATWRDGRIKQAMIARVLATRSRAYRLFSDGNYIPLETTGALSQHVVAFARTLDSAI